MLVHETRPATFPLREQGEHASLAAERFNDWADGYGEDRLSGWFQHIQTTAMSAFDFAPGGKFLDVGCGTGWAVREAAKHLGSGVGCGIDISPKMVEKARRLSGGLHNVEFLTANAERIPYSDDTFDYVLCTCSFHHYSAPDQALSEIRRVLKKNGKFILADSARDLSWYIWLQDWLRRRFERSHVKYYTTRELAELLREADLPLCRSIESIKKLLFRGKLLTALAFCESSK